MASLFKYIPEKYAAAFVKRGEILFRSLAYFRNFEDGGVRGDELEATRRYAPDGGVTVTKVASGETFVAPYTFNSTARDTEIFAFCLSTTLSKDLAAQFDAPFCIEITDVGFFLSGIRSSLSSRPSLKGHALVHGAIDYYALGKPPGTTWALPEQIAMAKPESYSWQHEYRVAFAVNGAFDFNKTVQTLVPIGTSKAPSPDQFPEMAFRIGSLSRHARIHRLL